MADSRQQISFAVILLKQQKCMIHNLKSGLAYLEFPSPDEEPNYTLHSKQPDPQFRPSKQVTFFSNVI